MGSSLKRGAALAATTLLLLGAALPAAALTVKVSITNNSSAGGVTLTPLYTAFHDGTFDAFNVGEAASRGLELLAEDGDASRIAGERMMSHPGSTGAVIAAPQGFADAPVIEPGETSSVNITLDPTTQSYFSYLSMILPSNDQFIGNDDPTAYQLFDAAGNFLGNQTIAVTGLSAYDAGTEQNIGDGAPFQGAFTGSALDESGVVGAATGIDLFAGIDLPNGQTLDSNAIQYVGNGGFTFATIEVTAVPVPAALPLMLGGLALMGGVAYRKRARNA